MPLNLFQLICEENHEEDQGDQYERKQDEVKEVRIHLFNPRRVDPRLMASVFHIMRNKVKIKIFLLWIPWSQPPHSKSD